MQAKFRVQYVEDATYVNRSGEEEKYQERVKMFPVYSDDPASENHAFWQATPAGEVSMAINNTAAFGFFEKGAEYRITFTRVD